MAAKKSTAKKLGTNKQIGYDPTSAAYGGRNVNGPVNKGKIVKKAAKKK